MTLSARTRAGVLRSTGRSRGADQAVVSRFYPEKRTVRGRALRGHHEEIRAAQDRRVATLDADRICGLQGADRRQPANQLLQAGQPVPVPDGRAARGVTFRPRPRAGGIVERGPSSRSSCFTPVEEVCTALPAGWRAAGLRSGRTGSRISAPRCAAWSRPPGGQERRHRPAGARAASCKAPARPGPRPRAFQARCGQLRTCNAGHDRRDRHIVGDGGAAAWRGPAGRDDSTGGRGRTGHCEVSMTPQRGAGVRLWRGRAFASAWFEG